MIITSLTEGDKELFSRFYRAYYKEIPTDCCADPLDVDLAAACTWDFLILRGIQVKKGAYLVARTDNKMPIGCLFWYPYPSLYAPKKPCVTGGVFVHKEHRQQGVATALRKNAASICFSQGFRMVIGTVAESNDIGAMSVDGFELVSTTYQQKLKALI